MKCKECWRPPGIAYADSVQTEQMHVARRTHSVWIFALLVFRSTLPITRSFPECKRCRHSRPTPAARP